MVKAEDKYAFRQFLVIAAMTVQEAAMATVNQMMPAAGQDHSLSALRPTPGQTSLSQGVQSAKNLKLLMASSGCWSL